MKLPEGYRVQLVRSDDSAYDEVRKGQERFVVAEPGQAFRVKVEAPAALLRQHGYIKGSLRLDGHKPGVSCFLSQSEPSYVFKGWVRTFKGQQSYAAFVFGDAQQQAGSSATAPRSSSPGSKTGLVSVSFCAATRDRSDKPSSDGAHHEGDWQRAGKTGLKDGKKWFLQPSATTKVGNLSNKHISWSRLQFTRGPLLLQAELRMETCPVLMLRKVLDPEKPRHQAIIARLTATADSSSDDSDHDSDDASDPAPHASSLTHATSHARVKTEPQQALRKRKRKAGLPNPNVLDLTAHEKRDHSSAEIQANVCDMTGDVDRPRWSVRPTQRVKIE